VVAVFELNVSCPNVRAGGVEFGADLTTLVDLVRRARDATDRPLVVKLSPALPDPARIAAGAAAAGADGFTAVNTLPALAYHADGATPRLGNGPGGMSGPRCCRSACASRSSSSRPRESRHRHRRRAHGPRRLQYLAAGASLVGVGTAALADPRAPERIVRELAAHFAGGG